MSFTIAGIKIKNRLVLAPMYRITDLPFRLLCREQGAALCYSELVNSEALIRNNKAAQRLALTSKDDRPLAMQVFGSRPESMKKAAEQLSETQEFDFLDINLGCPSANVINQGAGSALLRRPQRIYEIISSWVDLGFVVTAKIRISQNTLYTIALAKGIEKAGASALTVHARTVKQGHKGTIDFVALKRVKKSLGIPVIGNGNVSDKFSFDRMLEKTGCDAAMIGTAAIGNPGVFAEILGNKHISKEKAFFKYLELCDKFEVDYFGRKKQQAIRFFSHKKDAMTLFQKAETVEDLSSIAKKFAR